MSRGRRRRGNKEGFNIWTRKKKDKKKRRRRKGESHPLHIGNLSEAGGRGNSSRGREEKGLGCGKKKRRKKKKLDGATARW